ncbi:hypothetical protein PtB15_1B971 [Puccinia triticina]|nr:hypothetical protein PtB15_1B971 [Puccinia triticina]
MPANNDASMVEIWELTSAAGRVFWTAQTCKREKPPKEPITAGATGTIAGKPASSSNLASSDSSRPISDGIPSQSFGSLGRTISTTSGQPEALIESNSARAIDTRPASTSQHPDSSDSIRPVPPSSTQASDTKANH